MDIAVALHTYLPDCVRIIHGKAGPKPLDHCWIDLGDGYGLECQAHIFRFDYREYCNAMQLHEEKRYSIQEAWDLFNHRKHYGPWH